MSTDFQKDTKRIADLLHGLHNPLNKDHFTTLRELCEATNMQGEYGTSILAGGLITYIQRLLEAEKAVAERDLIIAQLNEGGPH